MIRINQKLEFSIILDGEKFQKVFNQSYCGEGSLEENEEEYVDLSLAHKRIAVVYRNNQYKKRVKIIVDLPSPEKDSTFDADKFVQKLEKQITKYFIGKYCIHDFFLSGMMLSSDIHVGADEQVHDYVRVLKRIGRVKGFTPSKNEQIDSENCFYLKGNSCAINFLICDLERAMREQLSSSSLDKKELKEMLQATEGVLRTEIHLTKRKAVQGYTDKADIRDQIAELVNGKESIFLDIFTQVIPFGDFLKKDAAMEILQKEVTDRVQRRKMMRLLVLIPDKKSVYLAQKEMNCRSSDKIMESFARLNLAPVTIGKRHNIKHLRNIYDYFL